MQVTRWAQLFCETLLWADVILLRCGRKSRGDAKERLKWALKRLLLTAADPNSTGRAGAPFSSLQSRPSKLLHPNSPATQTVSPSLPVSIYLISQKSFREEGMFVQTKWGPCSWLALLNTRITKRNKMCLILSNHWRGRLKKKKYRKQSDFIF